MELDEILNTHPELMEASISLLEILTINTTEPGDLHDTIATILHKMTDLVGADASGLLIINPITNQFLRKYTFKRGQDATDRFRSENANFDRLTQETLAKANTRERVLFVEHLARHPEYENPFESGEDIYSVATVTLLAHRKRHPKPLAILYVGFTQTRHVDKPKLTLLRILADQASSVLQHTWSLRRYKEVERIGHEINQDLESPEGVFQKLMKHVPGIIDTQHFFMMATHDAQKNTLDFYSVEEGHYQILKDQTFKDACAWVIDKRKRLSVRNYEVEKDELPDVVISVLEGTQPIIPNSLEFVPLNFRDLTLGCLSVQQKFPDAYDEEDRHILELLANHVALALTNLRLFDNLNRLTAAGQHLTSNLNSTEILALVTESIKDVARADLVALYPYLQEKQLFEFPIQICGTLLEPDFPKPDYSAPDDMATLTLNMPKPIFASDSRTLYADVGGDPTIRKGNFEEREKICSTAALPLRVSSEPVGVLFVNFRSPQHFRRAQRQLIEGMGNYAAIAIRNAREFGDLAHKRFRAMSVLQKIDRAISKTLDLQEILQRIVDEACSYLSRDGEKTLNGAILIHNPQTDTFDVKAAIGPSAKLRLNKSISLKEEKGITVWVVEHKVPARVDDVRSEQWKDRYYQIDSETRSELDVPLLNENDAVVGVISFESDRTNTFSQEDQDFLVTLGNQAILAIQNAQAYTREKQAKEAQEAVQKIQHQIVSELDFAKVAEFILEQALQVTRSKGGQVLLHDEQRNELYPVAEEGVSIAVSSLQRDRRTPADIGIAGWVMKNRKLLNVNITEPPWSDLYVRIIKGASWELAVPMLRGKATLGVINLESTDPFTEYHERFITDLADLAVIALSNSRSYLQSKDAVDRFQLLYQAGQQLGTVIDPANIENAYKFALQSFAKHKEGQVAIRRYDEEKKELILVHESRPSNTNPLYARMKIDEGVNGWVARHRRTLVIADTENPPRGINPKSSDPKTRTLVATPISFDRTYYGNLALSHQIPRYFRKPDVMLIEGLAQQLGLTIHRLETFSAQQDAERRAKESELMSSIGQSATELTHRLGGDLGLVGTYVEHIREKLNAHKLRDDEIEARLSDVLRDVEKVLTFNRALREDVKALQDEIKEEQPPALISVSTLLEEAERSFPNLPSTISLIRKIDGDLPDLRVVPRQIINSLANLVNNSIQAMPNGGTITLTAEKVNSDVEIAVHDTGTGIPANIRSRIFSLFFSTKGSSGFGLWSTHRNVIANGGQLKMETWVGRGSRFALLLPPAETV